MIYKNVVKKDKFETTDQLINLNNETDSADNSFNDKKNYRLNNPRLESIKMYIDNKQQILEDVEHTNCKLTQDSIDIYYKIKELEIIKSKLKHNKKGKATHYFRGNEIKTDNLIKLLEDEIKLYKEKLNNKYCPKFLTDVYYDNLKTSSFLNNINKNNNKQINKLNENINDYKNFSNDYGVRNNPIISNSLDYIDSYMQMKSFNDNVDTLEMMKDTTEFSQEVPPVLSEDNLNRIYPYNFIDFNGNYSINLGNFNHRIIDNTDIVSIYITTNIENTVDPNLSNKNLNNLFSNNDDNNIDISLANKKSNGHLKITDKTGETIMNFEILNIFRAQLPEFPTTTIFLNIKSDKIKEKPNSNLTENEKMLRAKKIKLLTNLGLKDGGIYIHGNDGEFTIYSFNKLYILNMSPV